MKRVDVGRLLCLGHEDNATCSFCEDLGGGVGSIVGIFCISVFDGG